MFARMPHMTEDTMVNTEMFNALDASDSRCVPVLQLWRSRGPSRQPQKLNASRSSQKIGIEFNEAINNF
jgi:hypothetical protein